MPLDLRIGVLADYAAFGQRGKLTIVHIFNQYTTTPEGVGNPVGIGILVARIEGSLIDGTDHRLTIRLVNADEDPQGPVIEIDPLTLAPSGPGLPLSAALLIDISKYPMPEPGAWVPGRGCGWRVRPGSPEEFLGRDARDVACLLGRGG